MDKLTERTLACFERHTRDGARSFRYFVDEVHREHAAVGDGTHVLILNSWFYGIAPPPQGYGSHESVEDLVRVAAQD